MTSEAEHELNRELNMLLAEADTTPPAWWWLSFCDPKKPKGTQFLGAALVHASNAGTACKRAWQLGINPGGQVAIVGPIPEEAIPGGHPREVLMSKPEIEAYGRARRGDDETEEGPA